jgi:hypothetical protein
MRRKALKRRPKITSIAIKSSGLWGLRYEESACFRLGTGEGRSCLRPPTRGLVEAARSVTEGSVYPDALELIGLGAIGSAEETLLSLASSPADFFYLVAKASSVGTSSSPLDTSTSMLTPR